MNVDGNNMNEEQQKRAIILLKVTQELLSRQCHNSYVLNLLAEVVYYDEAECDGNCLLNDIEYFLDELNDTTD